MNMLLNANIRAFTDWIFLVEIRNQVIRENNLFQSIWGEMRERDNYLSEGHTIFAF